ncbi:MAG: hypothetical protein LBM77_00090 [Spirochaetaceae bacterium]|jgi:hypothetical protein|nr:hypothetical protein [Spirochaetaceae bacterium]
MERMTISRKEQELHTLEQQFLLLPSAGRREVSNFVDFMLKKYQSTRKSVSIADSPHQVKKTRKQLRAERDKRDLELINANAKRLNREALDVLKYQDLPI